MSDFEDSDFEIYSCKSSEEDAEKNQNESDSEEPAAKKIKKTFPSWKLLTIFLTLNEGKEYIKSEKKLMTYHKKNESLDGFKVYYRCKNRSQGCECVLVIEGVYRVEKVSIFEDGREHSCQISRTLSSQHKEEIRQIYFKMSIKRPTRINEMLKEKGLKELKARQITNFIHRLRQKNELFDPLQTETETGENFQIQPISISASPGHSSDLKVGPDLKILTQELNNEPIQPRKGKRKRGWSRKEQMVETKEAATQTAAPHKKRPGRPRKIYT